MQLTAALYRNSIVFFGVFATLTVWGFWNTFYSNPRQLTSGLLQVHGVAMTLWFVMLLSQAFLIRTNQRWLHRKIGAMSYLLAPLLVVLMVAVVRFRLPERPGFFVDGIPTPRAMMLMSVTFVSAVLFAALYGAAIYFRRSPAVHGRLMLCTVFPILAPATDRIVNQYLMPGAGAWLPRVGGRPYPPTLAWAITDATLLALVVWDFRSHRRLNVFPLVLLGALVWQAFIANSWRVPAWQAFCTWFIGLGAGYT